MCIAGMRFQPASREMSLMRGNTDRCSHLEEEFNQTKLGALREKLTQLDNAARIRGDRIQELEQVIHRSRAKSLQVEALTAPPPKLK